MRRVNIPKVSAFGAAILLLFGLIYSCLDDPPSEVPSDEGENSIEPSESTDFQSSSASPDNQSGAGEIKVLNPKTGQRVLGTQVNIKGSAAHMDSLSIDENDIQIDEDGHWKTSIIRPPGLQKIQIKGTSTNGPKLKEEILTLIGEGIELDQPIDEGLVFFLSNQALTHVAQSLSAQIQPHMLKDAVTSSGPLYRNKWALPFGAGSVHLQVSLSDLDFDEVVSQVTAQGEQLDIAIQIHHLTAKTITSVTGFPDVESTILAERIILNCSLIPHQETDSIRVSIPEADVDIEGFQSPLSVPDLVSKWVSAELINDRIQATIESNLRDEIRNQLPQHLNHYLKNLKQTIELPIGDRAVSLTLNPSRLEVDPSGLTVAISQTMPVPTVKPSIPALQLGAEPPTPISGHSATLSVGDDLANRLLHQLWANGHLDFDLNTETGTLSRDVAKSLGSSQARLRISSVLPPVLIDTPRGIELQLGPIEVVLDSPNGKYGTRMALELVLWVQLEFLLNGQQIQIRQTNVQVDQTIVDHDWLVAKPIISTTLNLIIDLEDEIDRALQQVSIPIPSIPGIQLTGKAIQRSPNTHYMQGAIEVH